MQCRAIKSILKIESLLVFGMVLVGCAEVSPWERGILAKPQMALQPYPMHDALRAHNYGAREAASGVNSSEGGGCGCY